MQPKRRRQGGSLPELDPVLPPVLWRIVLVLSACCVSCRAQHSTDPPEYRAFQHPGRVSITNYSGDAMEPFLTHDGRYLFSSTIERSERQYQPA
jgi:hypothetical protein